jgi:hypothetical protein
MDLKESAHNKLSNAYKNLLQDLEALPEEAFTRSFGENVRTVADFIYEVNLVNDHICMILRGEKPFDWPEADYITAPADFNTKGTVIDAVEKNRDIVLSTIGGFTPEQMEEPFEVEGTITTRFDRCIFMTLHLWYHSGQLNYIQTLIGDTAWHWH